MAYTFQIIWLIGALFGALFVVASPVENKYKIISIPLVASVWPLVVGALFVARSNRPRVLSPSDIMAAIFMVAAIPPVSWWVIGQPLLGDGYEIPFFLVYALFEALALGWYGSLVRKES